MEENIATIRKRIGDTPKQEIEKYIGNGTLTGFDIHNPNPYNLEITIEDEAETGFEYDADIKKVLFEEAPAEDASVNIKYNFAAFTDNELSGLITAAEGNIDKATAEALRQAMGDQARMVSFTHGDKTVSMSDVFKNLMSLLNSYEKRITNEGANSGSSFEIGKRTLDEGPTKPYRPDDISRLYLGG